MTDEIDRKRDDSTSTVALIEEMEDDQSPMNMEDLKQLVLSMGDDDFLIQLSLTGEEDDTCL